MKPKPGTYVLIFCSSRKRRIKVGRLGFLELKPGYYLYVGSAFGPGGLRARTGRHRRITARPHWHIDYLKPWVNLIGIWHTHDPVHREHQWAGSLGQSDSEIPLAGFGSSDCGCAAHLFSSRVRPDPDRFRSAVFRKHPGHLPIAATATGTADRAPSLHPEYPPQSD